MVIITTAFFIPLPRNTNQDEEGTPVQQGGRLESVCKEADGTRGSSEPAECLGLPPCNAEPAGRLEVEEEEEEDEEEGCKSRENSPEGTRRSYSDAATDALLPRQHSSSQEGEVTYCSHAKDQKPVNMTFYSLFISHGSRHKTAHTFLLNPLLVCWSLPWIWISFPYDECFARCVKTLPWHLKWVASKQTAKRSSWV